MASGGGGKALFGVLGLVIGLIVGYGAGRVSTGTPVNPLMPSDNAPETPTGLGGPAAEFLPPSPTEAVSLPGTAVSVEGTRLTFDVDVLALDPRGSLGLAARRTARLTPETKIVRLVEKSPEDLAAEHAAFEAASRAAAPDALPPVFPLPFKETAIDATDIVPGDGITVDAASDVLRSESFDAVRVVVLPKPNVPKPADEPPPPAPQPVPEP
jgi:hypothetical protein